MEIYHSYSAKVPAPPPQGPSHLRFLAKLTKILAIVGIIFLLISFLPSVWYQFVSGGATKISRFLAGPVAPKQTALTTPQDDYQPAFNPNLPTQNRVKIPSAKIETPILEAVPENFEEALKKGVWRVPDFGTPANREKPTILAAHRYGYLAWSIAYRLKNSFYSLPKLKAGDTVEIIWRQRKYVYAVYKESKGEEIDDYTADLILYTCEALNSPIRIFKYARLLEI